MCLGLMLFSITTPTLAVAQSGKLQIKGVVVDAAGDPVLGAAVAEVGTTNGVTTDLNGQYVLNVSDPKSIISVSYIGYKTVELVATSTVLSRVVLEEDLMSLEEIVVIGYGAVKKNDMTGSVVAVKAEEINRGALTSPQEMLRGKVPGVNITSGSGAPGEGAEIRIRGGASLSANNNPLIVIDGVPVANEAGPGMANGLSMVNPNDIASFTVLKDASATAIYGSRASNGVILITTKKGQDGCPRVSYNGSASVKHNHKTLDMMSADEFREYAVQVGGQKAADLFGTANTDWQKEIFRLAMATDHNVSVTGAFGYGDELPYRFSAGYTYDQGTLKGSDNQRVTLDINLSPKFFTDHLSVNLNAKGIYNKSNYADAGAVGAAVSFDPTQSPYIYNADGAIDNTVNNGFWNWSTDLAPINPFSTLYDKYDRNNSYRALGNLQLDYKIHGFEDLSLNLNLGLDITKTKGDKGNLPGSIFANRDSDGAYKTFGRFDKYENLHRNQLLEFYANYAKEVGIHNINVMAGYSWSMNYSKTKSWNYGRTDLDGNSTLISNTAPSYRNALVSFYGRVNYSIASRYLFTVTMRADGSSRFVGKNRWGYFPSAAFAWNIGEEKFLKDSRALSALKLRLGWGVTGQQEFGENYAAQQYSEISQEPTNQYPLGDGFYFPVKPHAFNESLKWEETTTYNVGLDFGFINGRINGTVDAYLRQTDDLISRVAVPLGGNFSNYVYQNIGSMENKGVEVSLNLIPVQTENWHWSIGFSGTFQSTEIKTLPSEAIEVGSGGGGTGNHLQRHVVGYAPYTFYLWQQVYDPDGNPIQDAVVDRDGDGQITNADRYMTNKSPNPDFYYGVNMKLSYKNWDLGFNGHGTVGNYMFNDVLCGGVTTNYPDLVNKGYLINAQRAVTKYGFNVGANSVSQRCSDLFLEDASYFRLDDVSLGYTFRDVAKSDMSIRVAAGVQNVFVITNYSGLDPECSVTGGIDSNIYPRPRIYSVRLGINF
ncbi:MAG: TonB-dependent receptor [Rikenellaceae bacterium]|nr:TonB-dependent receptor [Rikenellaceae bacterium]MBP3682535.1 TonB-dependent receptor [Rikenellaceae bacterium]MBR4055174.1 TonB-dependent receptor [Rikenellaceae bacterium]